MIFLLLFFSHFAWSAESSPRAVITEHLSEAQDCYEARVKAGLQKTGKLVISWRINSDGTSGNFKSRSNETGDDSLYNCVVEKIKTWKFPLSMKSQIHTYLYTFEFKKP